MNCDIEADRNYIAGLKAGWNCGYKAGYGHCKVMSNMVDSETKDAYQESADKASKDFQSAINIRLKGIREEEDNNG